MINIKSKNSTKEFNYGLKMLFNYYKKHLKFLIGYISLLFFQAILNFFDAMFIAKMITSLMNDLDYYMAIMYALISLGLSILTALTSIVNTYFYKQLENRTKIDIQQTVLKSSLDIQMGCYDKMGSGIILTRLTSDIDSISKEFKDFTKRIVDLIKKSTYVIYIFFFNVYLGLILVGTILITILASKIRIHYFKKLKPPVKDSAEKVNSKIIEVIRGVKDIKVLNCTNSILDDLKKNQLDYCKKDNLEYYVGIGLVNFTNILKYICNFIFIILCVYFLKSECITPLVFYTCFLYKNNVLDFASILEDLKINLGNASVYANRIFLLTNKKVYSYDEYGDSSPTNFSGKITFKNVYFEYEKNNPVLKNLNFTIMPKQTVAFAGESGSGKSTIINLISHLYYKSSGDIYFDKTNIEELSKDFIKENIVVVNQFPYIFNISIRDNFKIINPNITDDEIFKLLKRTNIYDLVINLPLQLDSIIGENACLLSGGQKQKLCIARALSRKAKVLIFDEATSSLDNTNQDDIMKVIAKLKNKMTIILIAHRLSTITYADKIFLLDSGEIVASGKHDELLQKNDYYIKLYNSSKIIRN